MARGAAGSGGGKGGSGKPYTPSANSEKARKEQGKNEDAAGRAERAAMKLARDKKRNRDAKNKTNPVHVFMVFAAVMAALVAIVLSDPESLKQEQMPPMQMPKDFDPASVSQMQIEVDEESVTECETKSKPGDSLSMHYRGTLLTGNEFDSSYERGPFTFELGAGNVIRGWDEGLKDMCVGEKRKLTIPPHLGYGDRGAGGVIPPGATLLFDVELVSLA